MRSVRTCLARLEWFISHREIRRRRHMVAREHTRPILCWPSIVRLCALLFALMAGLAIALGVMLSAAQAAPVGMLKQYKVPSAGSSPEHITQASDGNFWFTESFVNDQNATPHKVGRITPGGEVTEFNVCDFCFPTDIVQGSDGILYFTKHSVWRYDIPTDTFTEFPAPTTTPVDVAVAPDGIVWFTDANGQIGRL